MPEHELSADARLRNAIQAVAAGLEKRGVLKDVAADIAQRHAERLFVSSIGSVRVAFGGRFYPSETDDPLEPLIVELYRSVPAAQKATAGEEDRQAMRQRLRRGGMY